MQKRVDTGLLLSFYGAMLTERQREMLRMYYEDDLSLSEIAQVSGVSRQGAHDAVRRGEQQLEALEQKLGLRARWQRILSGLSACRTALENEQTDQAILILNELMREEEEQDGI